MPQHAGNNGGGGKRGSRGKPGFDLEDRVQRAKDRLQQIMPSGPRAVVLIAVLALAGIVAWTAFYTVPSDSVAVVQRFGRYVKNVPPGLHFKLPLGVDAATIVPVKRQLKQEFGFKLKKAGFISIDPNTLPLHMTGSHSLILRPQPLVRHPTIARHSWSRNKGRRTE